ncbi:phosphoglycerate dehydrogenase-like enzyme [Glaciihabitans tibetensis]|uniref:Phosphoglycerate dehydrogenase-like enzyme n=1 Tax=Glaciihabitans tibetensis TaxID=1266600 RepID=A0A2T0V4F2_9MICO|nr:D-2-hydroxyacid dehydrogenase [Glaciihabitans tibetensis]PRY65052.1 phosphoglycerate dehydrogenase-like enzyme [Glaciihabitans tibetensis]
MSQKLRVVVASPLDEDLCLLIEERDSRVEVIRDHDLLPVQRHPGDHQGDSAFERTPEQQRTFDALVDSADVLYGLPDESATALRRTVAANQTLRWVHTTAAGGGAQVRAAKLSDDALQRIAFTQSAGVHAEPLAEFALLGVLAGLKSLPRLQAAQARSEWQPRWTMELISDQTIVVVGLGSIGRAVAAKLALLGARVIGVHRREVEAAGVEKIVPVSQLADVASAADAIIMTLPGTEATEKMLSAGVLARVKPGATVVNVGRGSTIDEVALIAALQDGRVGYAALDVFAKEPLAPDSPLWLMPNVLVSPHTSALHPNEDRLIAELFATNAGRLLDGKPLINRIDTVEFY